MRPSCVSTVCATEMIEFLLQSLDILVHILISWLEVIARIEFGMSVCFCYIGIMVWNYVRVKVYIIPSHHSSIDCIIRASVVLKTFLPSNFDTTDWLY
jgi:hypothetical protein